MGEIQKQHRRSIRLPGYDYSSPGDYLITICTHHKQSIFGTTQSEKINLSQNGQIAQRAWIELPIHFSNLELGPLVVMPNHIHGIITVIDGMGRSIINDGMGRGTACCAPTEDDQIFQSFGNLNPGSVPVIVRSYKSAVTNQFHQLQLTKQDFVWQRNYYESIITSDEEYARIAAYIEFNPENWQTDEENPDQQINRDQKVLRT